MNKTVMITGATRGIGTGLSIKFAKEGFNLCILSKNGGENLDRITKVLTSYNVSVFAKQCDVSDNEALKQYICEAKEKFGDIPYLINNAGIAYTGLLQDMSYEDFDRLMRTNLYSVYTACHELIPDMVRNKFGSIVNISSIWGNCGASCEVAYSASKSAVNGLTKALAKELAPSSIRVNAVAPGVIDTDMNSHLSESEMQELIDEIPMGRLGTPKDIADLVYDVAVKHPYMTGQIITMDGGFI